jgi:hypothetical protein
MQSMQREADMKLAELFYSRSSAAAPTASRGGGEPPQPSRQILLALAALERCGDEDDGPPETGTPAGCGRSHSDPVQDQQSCHAAVTCSVARELVRERCEAGMHTVGHVCCIIGWAWACAFWLGGIHADGLMAA